MPLISEQDVQYVAGLSRIHLRDDEFGDLQKSLEDILHYIGKLENLDVTDVEPTSHVLPVKNVFREDTAKSSLTQEEALKFSVEQYQGSFKVPKIIE